MTAWTARTSPRRAPPPRGPRSLPQRMRGLFCSPPSLNSSLTQSVFFEPVCSDSIKELCGTSRACPRLPLASRGAAPRRAGARARSLRRAWRRLRGSWRAWAWRGRPCWTPAPARPRSSWPCMSRWATRSRDRRAPATGRRRRICSNPADPAAHGSHNSYRVYMVLCSFLLNGIHIAGRAAGCDAVRHTEAL